MKFHCVIYHVNIDEIAMCDISMDSPKRASQTNVKLFFKSVFEILSAESFGRKPKNIQKNSEA